MFNTIIILIIALISLYKYFTRNHNYWKKRGVPNVKPLPVFGNVLDIMLCRKSIGQLLYDLYQNFNSPYFGIFIMDEPHIVIKDLDLIKSILNKDFYNFCDRIIVCDEAIDPISSKMLFFSKNPEWKCMKHKLTPFFTISKIKSMVPLMQVAAEKMNLYLSKRTCQKFIEIHNISSMYSTDTISSCAFGLDAKSFDSNNPVFHTFGKKMFAATFSNTVIQVSYLIAPGIVKLLKAPFFNVEITNLLRNVLWDIIANREQSQQIRNDLINILGKLKQESCAQDIVKFEGDTLIAQAIQYFTGTFHNISSLISLALYELSLAPDVQNKLRVEIKNLISKPSDLNYETLQKMVYLDMVISETLRKYPVLPFLERKCLEDYKVPNSDLVLKKGSCVFIPVMALHYDVKYFHDPEKFIPERFSGKNKGEIPNFAYLPFGNGPRKCIGEHFGLITSKLAIANIILEFSLEKSPYASVPMKFQTKGIVLNPRDGINIKFNKLVAN